MMLDQGCVCKECVLKACNKFKFCGRARPVARPADRQPIGRSQKDSGSILASQDKPFGEALY